MQQVAMTSVESDWACETEKQQAQAHSEKPVDAAALDEASEEQFATLVENLSIDALEDALTRYAANINAAQCHDHRIVHHHWDENGCLLLTARLTPEQGALVIKALDAAVEALHQDRPEAGDTGDASAVAKTEEPGAEQCPQHDYDLTDARTELETSSAVRRHRENRRADALALMADAMLQHSHVTANTADRYQVVVHVDQQVLSRSVQAAANGTPDCHVENGVGIAVETTRRLCLESRLVAMLEDGDTILSVGRQARAMPSSIQRALNRRDGGCQFPGCSASRFLHSHHIVHWADGGETSPYRSTLTNPWRLANHHPEQVCIAYTGIGIDALHRSTCGCLKNTSIQNAPSTQYLGERP